MDEKKLKWYERAKRLMKKKGVLQKDLIEVMGVKTRGSVGHYLTGIRDPDAWQVKALADYLGCTMDDLMGDEEGDPAKNRIATIIEIADSAMAATGQQFSDEEKISVYRASFSTGLDMTVTDSQLSAYLNALIKK
ncbi:MAG: helix-turn-helix domain-containing protein [Methylobacter sp.]